MSEVNPSVWNPDVTKQYYNEFMSDYHKVQGDLRISRWSDYDLDVLHYVTNCFPVELDDIASILGRSAQSVIGKLRELSKAGPVTWDYEVSKSYHNENQNNYNKVRIRGKVFIKNYWSDDELSNLYLLSNFCFADLETISESLFYKDEKRIINKLGSLFKEDNSWNPDIAKEYKSRYNESLRERFLGLGRFIEKKLYELENKDPLINYEWFAQELNVNKPTLSLYLNGLKKPEHLDRIAELLKVDVSELTSRINEDSE